MNRFSFHLVKVRLAHPSVKRKYDLDIISSCDNFNDLYDGIIPRSIAYFNYQGGKGGHARTLIVAFTLITSQRVLILFFQGSEQRDRKGEANMHPADYFVSLS